MKPSYVWKRSCGCLTPSSARGQDRWNSEYPGLVKVVPAHSSVIGIRWTWRSLPTQATPWFCTLCCQLRLKNLYSLNSRSSELGEIEIFSKTSMSNSHLDRFPLIWFFTLLPLQPYFPLLEIWTTELAQVVVMKRSVPRSKRVPGSEIWQWNPSLDNPRRAATHRSPPRAEVCLTTWRYI